MEQHVQCAETIMPATKHTLRTLPGRYGHLAVWGTFGTELFLVGVSEAEIGLGFLSLRIRHFVEWQGSKVLRCDNL